MNNVDQPVQHSNGRVGERGRVASAEGSDDVPGCFVEAGRGFAGQ
ncbi:MAG: hypothetical protein AB7G48_12075 [Nitrospiraceae bacterium]